MAKDAGTSRGALPSRATVPSMSGGSDPCSPDASNHALTGIFIPSQAEAVQPERRLLAPIGLEPLARPRAHPPISFESLVFSTMPESPRGHAAGVIWPFWATR